MSWLFIFVLGYLAISIGIGLYAARRVQNSRDYAIAGRNLPMPMVIATVFATWFGAETVLGISTTFVKGGLQGTVADPFGASLCLIFAGLFFARPLYRMNSITLADFYKNRYGSTVELLAAVAIIISYLGWVSAQIKALGLVFYLISDGAIGMEPGMILGASVVLAYTLYGGMWSVAMTDFLQMIIICVGMLIIAWLMNEQVGGVSKVLENAATAGKLQFFPDITDTQAWLAFIAAWVTIAFGSIPQQDVFQRMTSARTENIAVWGAVLGGSLYFIFAFLPIFISWSGTMLYPDLASSAMEKDFQEFLPSMILQNMPLWVQVLFFGALLSAIMSTASATLLAPSVMFSENILRRQFAHLGDKQLLQMMRVVVVLFAIFVTIFTINSTESIFEMVGNSYKITLVCAFVPLVFGIYWKKANNVGALLSMLGGLVVWVGMEINHALDDTALFPPQLAGLLVSAILMIIGSLAAHRLGHLKPSPSDIIDKSDKKDHT